MVRSDTVPLGLEAGTITVKVERPARTFLGGTRVVVVWSLCGLGRGRMERLGMAALAEEGRHVTCPFGLEVKFFVGERLGVDHFDDAIIEGGNEHF